MGGHVTPPSSLRIHIQPRVCTPHLTTAYTTPNPAHLNGSILSTLHMHAKLPPFPHSSARLSPHRLTTAKHLRLTTARLNTHTHTRPFHLYHSSPPITSDRATNRPAQLYPPICLSVCRLSATTHPRTQAHIHIPRRRAWTRSAVGPNRMAPVCQRSSSGRAGCVISAPSFLFALPFASLASRRGDVLYCISHAL